jgi:phosphoglycolate phosphatase-like HAD superfamily hydrolase
MVGDTLLDVKAGLAANLETIGIAHTEEVKQAMKGAGVGFIASSMQELWSFRSGIYDN